MIKVEKITIEEFRGIRSLTLEFNGESFAIAGPNGTGKSGVVDAIEFALTGNVSRLSGQGRGDLSVLKHGPHVDSSKNPEKSKVSLEVFIPSLNQRVSISRTVKTAKVLTITPETPEIRAIFDAFADHPEFALSRREIIKYVLAEPGVRADEVQALLQLGDLEEGRAMFLRISNAAAKELKPLEQEESSIRESFMRALGIDEITQGRILAAANEKRKVIGLPELPKLGASLKDGMDSLPATTASKIPKVQAKADIAAAVAAIKALESSSAEVEAATEALKKLQANEADLKALEKESMLRTALRVFDDHACPICETEWKPEHFRQVVEKQLERLKAATGARIAAEKLLTPITKKIEDARVAIRAAAGYGPLFLPIYSTSDLDDYRQKLADKATVLRKFLPIEDTLAASEITNPDSTKALAMLEDMAKLVEAIPDPNDQDAAREYLTTADERFKSYRIFASKLGIAKKKADTAKRVYDIFTKTIDEALEDIYRQVEEEFKRFYRSINDDESAFEAKLTPSIGKLSFGVDFYGRGSFPPGAYHSEGHQDAMGLCLYLALMKHILGSGFTLSVLDDVLMSVDTGHRREVCRLLKTEFPDTQFILTTHDPVWLRHMKRAGLIEAKAGIEFQSWNVDNGPTQWKDIDVWGNIDALVDKNEIGTAAFHLRNYLEYLAAEYCGELGGKVEYRGDNHYELGDLLPGAVSAMKKRLKEAKEAAVSWGDADLQKKVEEREAAFDTASKAALGEQWMINPVIHYNEWANLSKSDFKPVAAAFKTLSEQFICKKCGGALYASRSGRERDALRCPCPEVNLTLLKKRQN